MTTTGVIERLTAGPATTEELVLLHVGSALDARAIEGELHRHSRRDGYGQCPDRLWRLATDSDYLQERAAEDLPTHVTLGYWEASHHGSRAVV